MKKNCDHLNTCHSCRNLNWVWQVQKMEDTWCHLLSIGSFCKPSFFPSFLPSLNSWEIINFLFQFDILTTWSPLFPPVCAKFLTRGDVESEACSWKSVGSWPVCQDPSAAPASLWQHSCGCATWWQSAEDLLCGHTCPRAAACSCFSPKTHRKVVSQPISVVPGIARRCRRVIHVFEDDVTLTGRVCSAPCGHTGRLWFNRVKFDRRAN